MKKGITYHVWVFLIFGLFFISCKKYPENRLWFKKPERAFKGGKLTSFTVNGVDSITLLNSTWGFDLTANNFSLYKPYHDNSGWDIKGDFDGYVAFKGDKEIIFRIKKSEPTSTQPTPLYNPFLYHGDSDGKSDDRWDILKLTRKGVLKLRRKMNGKVYELQIN